MIQQCCEKRTDIRLRAKKNLPRKNVPLLLITMKAKLTRSRFVCVQEQWLIKQRLCPLIIKLTQHAFENPEILNKYGNRKSVQARNYSPSYDV